LVKPMYIFDGKEIAEEELQTLKKIVGPPIKAQMLSDSVAVKTYGEKGKNGVVIMNSEFGKEVPLYIVDDVETTNIDNILTENIEKIVALKGESATKLIGDKGKNGVVFITTKKFADNGAKKNSGNPLIIVDGKEFTGNVNDLQVNEIGSMYVIKNKEYTKIFGEKAKDGIIEITTKTKYNSESPEIRTVNPKTKNNQEEPIFSRVEEMPQFPGGELALRKYIANELKYPVIAQENGIQGKVYVSFIITKEGKVTEPSISRGVDPALDKEALRVIGSLPDWKPGKQGGQAVNVWYTVPITFGLQNQNSTNDGKTNIITSVQELRQFIANQVVFPKEARDEHNSQMNMFFYIKINQNGEVIDVTEKPNGEIIVIDEIVITAERDKTVLPELNIKNGNLMAAEAERVLKSLPKIEIPELKGKTARLHFMFVLR
jgi:TonB family protein